MGIGSQKEAAFLKPTVGLTRYLFLMNLCEKSGVWANVYAVFCHFEKHVHFRDVKKLFSPGENRPKICRGKNAEAGEELNGGLDGRD